MANIIDGRLYSPATDPTKPNERDPIHLETDVDRVLTRPDGTTLREDLGVKIKIGTFDASKDKPSLDGSRDIICVTKVKTVSDPNVNFS